MASKELRLFFFMKPFLQVPVYCDWVLVIETIPQLNRIHLSVLTVFTGGRGKVDNADDDDDGDDDLLLESMSIESSFCVSSVSISSC